MLLDLNLPEWLTEIPPVTLDDESAMALALQLAERNIQEGGGPFAALILDAQGLLLSAGVNRVRPAGCSLMHAEMVAILLAQLRMHNHDLSGYGAQLYSTCAPCAMCWGALPWAGIKRLIWSADTQDAEQAGFDEGDKPVHWESALLRRGIQVRSGLLPIQGQELLRRYSDQDGAIY
ncbi:MAG: nucleoside deaminase [Pseudomonadales bacterium]|nr:nucleoside deaminase [Pseudomonadales bacterium]